MKTTGKSAELSTTTPISFSYLCIFSSLAEKNSTIRMYQLAQLECIINIDSEGIWSHPQSILQFSPYSRLKAMRLNYAPKVGSFAVNSSLYTVFHFRIEVIPGQRHFKKKFYFRKLVSGSSVSILSVRDEVIRVGLICLTTYFREGGLQPDISPPKLLLKEYCMV